MEVTVKDELEPLFFETLLLIARFNHKFMELASLLHQLHETAHHDFKTLISIPQLGRRKGYYLVEVDKAFGGNEHLRPRLNKIGWTKLQTIAKHVTPDNREDLLKLAEAHTVKNLERIMRGEKPTIGGRSVLLHFTAEQFAAFSKAILAHGAIENGAGFIGKEAALFAALEKNKE